MNGLAQQLGGLVLGSVPTIILFLITLAAYQVLVHAPLKKVLRERYDRTQGAIEKAAAAIAAAEKKTTEYEERLRTARAAVFHVRHERLHQVHVESELALDEARAAAQERTGAARVAIEDSVQAARLQMESMIEGLATQVLRAVLPPESGPQRERAG